MKNVFQYSLLIGLTTNQGMPVKKAQVINTVGRHIQSFSVVEQTGYWNGQEEISLNFTFIGLQSELELNLENLAVKMRRDFEQDAVYLTSQQITLFDINSEYVPRETLNSKVKRYSQENEHKLYPYSDWQYEVKNEDTKLGYNTWVQHQIEANN